MSDKTQLDAAIAAHGTWKARLKTAIETGKTETSLETIRMDNQCAFGKWLYGPTLTPADKASTHYKAVKDLHATFHQSAAQVTELSLAGKKADAEKLMAPGGGFAAASGRLTVAMIAWRKSLD